MQHFQQNEWCLLPRLTLKVLVNFNREFGSEIERVQSDETAEKACVEVVVADAIAPLAIGIFPARPQLAAVDSFLDYVFGNQSPIVQQEKRTFEHDVLLYVARRRTVPVVVKQGECAA